MAKKNILDKIVNRLGSMQLGEEINKTEFITSIYGSCDKWKRRSFDVFMVGAKKRIAENYPFKEFITNKNDLIIRSY
jgi:hypothetical protein